MSIKDNTTALNDLKSKAQNLPNKGSVDTSELTATSFDVVNGYKFIGQAGTIETGSVKEYISGQLEPTFDPSEEGGKWFIPSGIHRGNTYFKPTASGDGSGYDTSDATAGINDVLEGKIFYNADGCQVGVMPKFEKWEYTIDDGSSINIPRGWHDGYGRVYANSSDVTYTDAVFNGSTHYTDLKAEVCNIYLDVTEGGYIDSGKYLVTEIPMYVPEEYVVPSKNDILLGTGGKYVFGDIKVKGDENLVSSNIKSGISIFGVYGTYAAGKESLNVTSVDVVENEDSGNIKIRIYFDNMTLSSADKIVEIVLYNSVGTCNANSSVLASLRYFKPTLNSSHTCKATIVNAFGSSVLEFEEIDFSNGIVPENHIALMNDGTAFEFVIPAEVDTGIGIPNPSAYTVNYNATVYVRI